MANDIVRNDGTRIVYVDPNDIYGYGGENGKILLSVFLENKEIGVGGYGRGIACSPSVNLIMFWVYIDKLIYQDKTYLFRHS